jgi:hypothetical protein
MGHVRGLARRRASEPTDASSVLIRGPGSVSRLRERCPTCDHKLVITRFDTTFRLPDRTERLCFGIPAGLCEDCSQLYIDPDLIELLDLGDSRCVFAIESDLVVQEQAWSSAE